MSQPLELELETIVSSRHGCWKPNSGPFQGQLHPLNWRAIFLRPGIYFIIYLFILYVCLIYVYELCAYQSIRRSNGKHQTWNCSYRGFWATVLMLGIKSRFFRRVDSALNHWANLQPIHSFIHSFIRSFACLICEVVTGPHYLFICWLVCLWVVTGSLYVVLASLEVTIISQGCLELGKIAWLLFPSAEVKGMCCQTFLCWIRGLMLYPRLA